MWKSWDTVWPFTPATKTDRTQKDDEAWEMGGVGGHLSESRCNLFVSRLPVKAGVTLRQVAQCSLASHQANRREKNQKKKTPKNCWEIKRKGIAGAGWKRGQDGCKHIKQWPAQHMTRQQPYRSTYAGGQCSDEALLCEPLRRSTLSAPETPADPHARCYHNKQWNSSNNHKCMQASWHARAHTLSRSLSSCVSLSLSLRRH